MERERSLLRERRYEISFKLLNRWLKLWQRGKCLMPYFTDNLLENAAIYGMGALGERLFDELNMQEFPVVYGIDRIAGEKNFDNLTIYNTEEHGYPTADVIIVTPTHDYWEIVTLLELKTDIPAVSLEDVIMYCENCSL